MTTHPDCHCPRTTHAHGNRTTYVIHACRCQPCIQANGDAARARNRAKAYGRYNKFVDGDLVRAHLCNLMGQGMGWKRASLSAGVSPSTTYAILYGKLLGQPDHPEHRPPRIKVARPVADKLMAVGLDLAPGAKVPGHGTTRRIQALVAAGWSASEVARRLGFSPANFTPILHGRRDATKKTADATRTLYDQLWDQEPPPRSAKRARTLAAHNGWAPPLAWDDDTIDNPAATPDMGDELAARRWHIEDAQWLLSTGASADEVASRMGVQLATIAQAFGRAGLPVTPFTSAISANRKAA